MYVAGMQVRYNDRTGIDDDTALNGLSIICRDPLKPGVYENKTVHWGNWGVWKIIKQSPFVQNTYVCGAEVRYQDPTETETGVGVQVGDNTGLNGIKVKMCKLEI